VVEAGFAGYRLDRVVNCTHFWAIVVSNAKLPAGVEHDGFVVVEPGNARSDIVSSLQRDYIHVHEGDPVASSRPSSASSSVTIILVIAELLSIHGLFAQSSRPYLSVPGPMPSLLLMDNVAT